MSRMCISMIDRSPAVEYPPLIRKIRIAATTNGASTTTASANTSVRSLRRVERVVPVGTNAILVGRACHTEDMGLYADHILPRLVDVLLGNKEIGKLRRRALQGVSGS